LTQNYIFFAEVEIDNAEKRRKEEESKKKQAEENPVNKPIKHLLPVSQVQNYKSPSNHF
jgi:hypothetical protein